MRRVALGLLLILGAVSVAEAQIPLPFFKKKKKEQPPAEAAAKAPAEKAAPGAPAPAAPAAAGDSAAGAAPAITPSAQPVQPAPGAPPGLTPAQDSSIKQMIATAISRDAQAAGDTSMAVIQERMTTWQQIMFALPPTDPRQLLAKEAYDRALKAGDDARARALAAGTASAQTKKLIDDKLAQCERELSSKEYANAERSCREVLAQDPENVRAKGLLEEARRGKRIADLWRKVAMYSAVLVPLLALLGLAVRAGLKKREESLKKAEEAAAKRSAVLQIVDGVGRGRLVTIDKEKTIFKIGAAMGASDAEKNDLVISDSAAQVSRFHCTLVRKDGEYFVVDSSMNGTVINGDAMKRGEHYPLEDGDEITIAQVSRLKFLHT